MRALIQKVSTASITVDSKLISEIHDGLLIYVGFFKDDTEKDMDYILDKILHLRIFEDNQGVNNLSVQDVQGELLIVSQFTLCADARHGRRPSYSDAASPDDARSLYEIFLEKCSREIATKQGQFQAHMKVRSVNEGPMTIMLDSRRLF